MKAYLIDVAAREIRAVEYADTSDLQKLVGGYIECAARWPSGDVCYVDEEFLFKPQGHWFRVPGHQPLGGNGVVVGPERSDDFDGDYLGTDDPVISLEQLRTEVQFLSRAQVDAWAKANASEPAIAFTSIGPDGVAKSEVITRYGALYGDVPRPEDQE